MRHRGTGSQSFSVGERFAVDEFDDRWHNTVRMRHYRILVCLLALALTGQSAQATPGEVQVLLSSDTEIYAAGLNGIQSSLSNPLRIHYLDALAPDDAGLETYFRELEGAGRTLLVIAVGTRAARAALKYLTKVPLVFSMVSAPRTLGAAVNRSCGVSMDVPVERFFETLKEVAPAARRVAAFFSTTQGEHLAGEGEYSDLRSGLFFEKVRVSEREGLGSALQKVKGRIDALYLVADPLYDRLRFREISEFSKKNHVVLMTSFASLVQAGATFGLTPDYFRLGVLTGEMADRILSGRSTCQREAVQYGDRISLYVNEDFAARSGISLPPAVRKRASLTRLINAGIRLFNQGRHPSARKVFEAVLERDPRNRAAFLYRARIVEKETGEQTRKLLDAAIVHTGAGRYAEALADYRAILTLNPGHRTAARLLEDTRRKKSESERASAQTAAARGDIFGALRLYHAAIHSLPENTVAVQELNRLRAGQSGRVPALFADGLSAYNGRRYDIAIHKLDNVLLLQPGHKQAVEYLRLSRKKKEAVERLLRRQGARQ